MGEVVRFSDKARQKANEILETSKQHSEFSETRQKLNERAANLNNAADYADPNKPSPA